MSESFHQKENGTKPGTVQDAFGGQQPTTALSAAQFAALPQVPADGTFIRGGQTGQIYRIAGGAPEYVVSWANVGGAQSYTNVDQAAIDNAGGGGLWVHLNATPANGTFITSGQTGDVYRVAGGAPIYVSSWGPFGGSQPYTVVDQAVIDNASGGGIWKHLNALPADGTFLTGLQTGQVFETVGGAPVYVSSWDAFGGSQSTVGVDQVSLDSAGSAAPYDHLNFFPATGTFVAAEPSGNVFEIVGGHPKYINSWSQVGGPQPYSTVNDATINGAGSTDTTNPFSHLLQAEANNISAPTLVGTATVGKVIFASPGVWGPGAPTFTYAWYANGVIVPGKVAFDFVPTSAMVGKKITFTVTDTPPNFLPQSMTAATQTVAPGRLTTHVPTITGRATVSDTLTAHAGTWTAGTRVTYQWFANGKAISRATAVTFKVAAAEKGKTMTVKATGSLAGYKSATTTSKATGKVN